ncbi:MAG TPA: hypothetical protein HPP56_05650 [Nitrospirae bacterium]|nr:hypothetical protein [Nitrospirota bacterium]
MHGLTPYGKLKKSESTIVLKLSVVLMKDLLKAAGMLLKTQTGKYVPTLFTAFMISAVEVCSVLCIKKILHCQIIL